MQRFSWLSPWMTGGQQTRRDATRKPTARFRPQLEIFERRELLSTFTVTNNLGYGAGSLRDAVYAASNPLIPGTSETIVFDKSLSGQTIHLSTNNPYDSHFTELAISGNVDIEGPGAANLTIDADHGTRVFDVAYNAHATISGLTIKDGVAYTGSYDPDPSDGHGGGIYNAGTLTMNGCTVSGNDASGPGGPVGWGGGIYNSGTLTMNTCTVTGNHAGDSGGGIYNGGGTLTVLNSTVTGNTAAYGANDLFNYGTLSVSNSTIGKKKYK